MEHTDRNQKDNFTIKSLVFLCFFALVFVTKYQTLNLPPVWDTVSGTFAPAIFLFENGFNFSALIEQPGWWYGGANTHSFSLITFITAITIQLTNGVEYFAYLHLFNYGLTALILCVQYYLVSPITGRTVALFASLITFLFPPFFAQSGYMYTEIAGSAFFILALTAWYHRHSSATVIFGILAVLTKSFGIISTVAITLLLLLEAKQTSSWDRKLIIKSILLLSATAIVEIVRLSIMGSELTTWPKPPPWQDAFDRLLLTPDIFILLATVSAGAVFTLLNRARIFYQPSAIYQTIVTDIKKSNPINNFYILSLYLFLLLVIYKWGLLSLIMSSIISAFTTIPIYLLARDKFTKTRLLLSNFQNDLRTKKTNPINIFYTFSLYLFLSLVIYKWVLHSLIVSSIISAFMTIPIYLLVKDKFTKARLLLSNIQNDLSRGGPHRLLIGTTIFTVVFIVFILLVAIFHYRFLALSRYYTWILPIAVINIILLVKFAIDNTLSGTNRNNLNPTIPGKSLMIIAGGATIVTIMSTNLDGAYYPRQYDIKLGCSKLERSMEYLECYRRQKETLVFFEKQNNLPIFLPLSYYHLTSSPIMGYVKKRMDNAIYILDAPYRDANLNRFPKQFIAPVSSYVAHGSAAISKVLTTANLAKCHIDEHVSSYGTTEDENEMVYIVNCNKHTGQHRSSNALIETRE